MRVIPAHARKATLIVALLTSVAPVAVLANPVDGTVAAGSASIASSGSTLTINQASDKAVIDWRGFDVGAGETTNFVQPSSHALTLNRVGSGGASRIDGNVTANGNIVIVNPNGIVFGAGSHVDVNGLVATTANISNANAMAGNLRFDQAGNPTARIENHGSITARDAGLVGLVAPNVINSGIITARLGRVHLASGDTATVDLYGDGLIEVKASDALTHQLVQNTGTISAQGGTIALTAAAGRETVDSLVQVSGLLDARSIGTKDGHIFIYAQGAPATSNAAVPANVGRVVIAGTLDVSNASGNGGRVEVAGNHITLAPTAIIDANGTTGGGIVRIGADVQGAAIIAPVLTGEMQGPALPTADEIILQAGSSITANALTNGNGGTVVLYADTRTEFAGTITADGAGTNGEGGFVETSGRVALTVNGGTVSATGRRKNGTWLLDPADITITTADANSTNTANTFTATNTGSTIAAATIKSILDGGTNVTIQTSNDGFAGNGDITVSSAITTTGAGSLTLSAYRNISVNAAITLNGGALTLRADNTGNSSGGIYIGSNISTNGGNITVGGGSGAITAGSGYAVGNDTLATVIAYKSYGIAVNTAATINSAGGNIIMNGRGYGGTIHDNYGVFILGTVTTGTAGSGSLSLNGIGGGSGNSQHDYGTRLATGSNVSTFNGTLTMVGTGGGAGTGNGNDGILNTGIAKTTGSGNLNVIAIAGNAGSTGSNGITANTTNDFLTTGSGSITVRATSTGNGFAIVGGAANVFTTTGTGNVTIYADSLSLSTANTINSVALLTLAAYSNIGMSIGSNVGGTFNVSNALLGYINAASYIFGSATTATGAANTGNVAINTTANFGVKNVSFISGNDLRTNGAYTSTGNGSLTLSAVRDLNVSSGITLAGGALLLRADNTGIGIGGIAVSGAIATNGGNITMGGGSGAITGAILNADGTINTAASGYALGGVQSGYGIGITNTLDAAGGNIILNGKGVNGATNSNYGAYISGAVSTSGTGTININGVGQGTSTADIGVYLNNSSVTNSGSGSTIIIGFGGGTGINNTGIYVTGETISVASGTLNMVGTGGGASTTGNTGIALIIGSTITGSGGNITLIGTTGSNSSSAVGVQVNGSSITNTGSGKITLNGTATGQTTSTGVSVVTGAIVSTANGALTITGIGGTGGGTGSSSHGVAVQSSTSRVLTTGGTLSITGTGGTGSGGTNNGIYVTAANLVQTSNAGNIFLYGVAGSGATAYGIHVGSSNGIITTGTGNITAFTDTINFTSANSINSAGILTLAPYSNIGMSVGTNVATTFNVSNTMLGYIVGASYVFGSTTTGTGAANTGDLTVNTTTNFSSKNLTFIAGRDINIASSLTKTSGTAVNYLFQANRDIYNSSSAAVTSSAGAINMILDANYAGAGGGITLTNGGLTSLGGDITLGGGSGVISAGSGYAVGRISGGTTGGVALLAAVNAGGGNIIVNGIGFNSAGDFNAGVNLDAGGGLYTIGAGNITINGIGGGGTGVSNRGLRLYTGGGISTVNGTITINGTGGGSGTSSTNYGFFNAAGYVRTSGSGNINITGTGGNGSGGNNHGVLIQVANGIQTTGTGSITISGVRGSSGFGFNSALSNSVVSTTGNITIFTDTISLTGANSVSAGGILTLATYTNISMGVGALAGATFNLSEAQLNLLAAGTGYVFGSTTTATGTVNSSDMTINTTKDFGTANVSFVSGGNIALNNTLTKSSGVGTTNYLLQANGNITNSAAAGIVATSGAINLTLDSDTDISGAGFITLTSAPLSVNGGSITLNSHGQAISQSGSISGNETINSANGAVSIGTLDGDIAGTRSLTVNAGTATVTTTGIIGGTNKLNNLTFASGDISVGGDLYGSGILLFDPYYTVANSKSVSIGAIGGQFALDNTEIARIKSGWSEMQVGHTGGALFDVALYTTTLNTTLRVRGTARDTIAPGGHTVTTTNGASLIFEEGFGKIYGDIVADGSISFNFTNNIVSYLHNTLTSQNGNINFLGTILLTQVNGDGSLTLNAANGTVTLQGIQKDASATGNFSVTGTNVISNGLWGIGFALNNATLTATNSVILPTIYGVNVNVTVTGAGKSITENGTIGTGTNGNITLTADDLILGGSSNFSGTGTLTLQPYATNRQVYVNYGTADGTNWNLSTAEIARFTDGWGNINIGRSDAVGPYPNGYASIGASTWTDPTTFRGYASLLYGSITGTGNAAFTFASAGNSTEFKTNGVGISTQGGNISIGGLGLNSANNSITSNGGAISIGGITGIQVANIGNLNVASGNGNINVASVFWSGVINSGTLNFTAGTGTLAFGGPVNTPVNVSASANTITFANAWGAVNSLYNVTLTSVNSIILPAITKAAGYTVNATVTGAGNSITANNAIATGTGGNITLTSDDLILNNNLSGSGTLTLQPYSTNRTVNVNYGTADGTNWNLSTAEIARLVNGWSSILIGNTGTTSVDLNIGTSTWSDPLTFRSNSRAILLAGSTLTTTDNAPITFNVNWFNGYGSSIINSAAAVAFNTASINGFQSYGSAVNAANSNISFSKGITLNSGNLALNAGTGTIAVTNGVNGAYNFTASGNAITFGSDLGNTTALNAVTLTSATTLTLPSITAASILAQATGAAADIVIAAGKTLTASGSGNALTLVAGRNFINNSGGSALAAASGRWLVYSTTPVNNTRGGLLPDASDFNRTYAGNPPASIGAGNRFEYATATAPVLTYTTGNGSAIYGDAYSNASTTSTYSSGLISGDTLGTIGLTGTSGGTNTYVQGTTDASVTPYSGMLTATVGSLASKLGYTFAFTGGDLTVNKRTITASVTGSVSKQYDGTTAATLSGGSYSLSNVYGADAVGIATTAGTYDTKDTATGKTVSVSGLTLNGAKAGNYVLSSTSASGATGIVTQKALTITADNKTITYGGAITPGTASYTGFIAGEDATYLTTGPVVASANSGLINAGLYNGNYTASGAAATNYSISYVAGNLTVAKKALDVTADNKTITYGDAITAGSVSYNGFIAGQDASFLTSAPTVGSGQSGIINAGMYAGNYTPMGGTSSNYSFNYFTGDLTVAKKNLNVTADNKSVTYGTAVPAGTLDYNGFITGEDASFLGTAPSVASTASGVLNVGTYSGNYTPSGGSSSNYSFTYVTGNLSVTAAGLNVTAGNRTVTYGTAVPADTYTITGYLNGDDVTALSSLPTLSSTLSGIVNAGSYLGNFITSGGTAMNYYFNYIPGDLTVSKKSLNVTADNKTITYGSMIPTGTFTYNGFVNGENASVLMTAPTVSSTQSGIVNAGSYAGNFTLSGGSDGNYSFNYVSGGLNVGKASLTITANDRTITYGTAVPTGTYSITGYVNGENATALSTLPGVASVRTGILDAGSYANNYIASGAAAGNYTFTYVMGDLAVLKAALFVTTDSKTKLNGAPDPVFTGSNTLLPADAALISWAYAPAGYAGLVGSYVITATATDAGNRLANYLRTDHEGVFTVNADIAVPPPPAFTSSDLPDNVSLVSQDPASYLLDHTGLYENIALHQDTIFAHDDGEHHYIFTYDRPDGTNAQGQLNLLQLITIAPQLQTQLGIQQAL